MILLAITELLSVALINMFAILMILAKLATPDFLKDAFSGLRHFLAMQNPLKIMNSAFYFTLKAFFVLKIFKSLSWLFGHVENRFD